MAFYCHLNFYKYAKTVIKSLLKKPFCEQMLYEWSEMYLVLLIHSNCIVYLSEGDVHGGGEGVQHWAGDRNVAD